MKNTTDWQNCHPQDYTGEYPMINICDEQESYCAAMGDRTEHEMVDEFVETYQFNDETSADPKRLRDALRDEISVEVHAIAGLAGGGF